MSPGIHSIHPLRRVAAGLVLVLLVGGLAVVKFLIRSTSSLTERWLDV